MELHQDLEPFGYMLAVTEFCKILLSSWTAVDLIIFLPSGPYRFPEMLGSPLLMSKFLSLFFFFFFIVFSLSSSDCIISC